MLRDLGRRDKDRRKKLCNLPVETVSGRRVGVYGVTAETLIASVDTLMGDTGLGVKL